MNHPLITAWTPKKKNPLVDLFLQRPAFDPAAEVAAAEILADIRQRGVNAILDAAKKFDGAKLTAKTLRVTQRELDAAQKHCTPAIRKALTTAHKRVKAFAEAGLREDWLQPTPGGGAQGEIYTAMDRVGCYIPGGTAPLASTAIMTVTLAKAAGVKQIVACTPSGKDGKINPILLCALQLSGATEIYRVGGIQSIGLMAYGAPGIPAVQLIAGPGNAYVTAAKRQVYGYAAIDQVAGPSEIAILADETANPKWVAADLLSQAEHGSGHERSLLVTTSRALAEQVTDEILWQIQSLSRQDIINRVIAKGGILSVIVDNLDDGIDLINRFAPEHLELQVKKATSWLNKVRCAGAVFVGHWTPESAGDFVAGPSHVLPTGGAARMYSGLTADTFRKRTSFVEFTQKDLQQTRAAIQTFGEIEGLDAHANAAAIRFKK